MKDNMETNTGTEQQVQPLAVNTTRAAQMLGVSQKTVYRLLQRGKIQGVRVLRTHMIPMAELEKLVGGKN